MSNRHKRELLGSIVYMQVLRQHKVLITEKQFSDINPLYELVNTTQNLPRNPQPISRNVTNDTHPQSGAFSTAYDFHNKVSINRASIQIA